jgi:hypothetical protein
MTMHQMTYSPAQRFWLWILCIFGFMAINSVFIFGAIINPEVLREALANPVALAFVIEALLLTGVFAALLTKWGVARLHWGWFIVLSLLGSMAFALPIVLLWPGKKHG